MDILGLICAEPLDVTSETPLYRQLEQRFLRLIASDSVGYDTPLPTEMELCEALGLSRATVRRCFADLVDEGRVVRKRGLGTFIAPPSVNHTGPFLNFSQRMASAGLTPSSRTLGFKCAEATEEIARRLGVEAGAAIYVIRRLRLADERPMTIDTMYLPCERCPGITDVDLEQSLYALIAERSGKLPERVDEVFEAVSVSGEDAMLLGVETGQAAFLITRTTYDATGEPIEVSITLAPGDRNRYELSSTSGGTVTPLTPTPLAPDGAAGAAEGPTSLQD